MTDISLISTIETFEAHVARLRGNIIELESALAERHARFGKEADRIAAKIRPRLEAARTDLADGEAELCRLRRTARGGP